MIVGSEPCVVVDFVGFQNYAKKSSRPAAPGAECKPPDGSGGFLFTQGIRFYIPNRARFILTNTRRKCA